MIDSKVKDTGSKVKIYFFKEIFNKMSSMRTTLKRIKRKQTLTQNSKWK